MTFADLKSALAMRELIGGMVAEAINRLRPEEKIGKVYSIDSTAQTAQILLAGETMSSLVTARWALDKRPTQTMDTTYDVSGINAPSDIVRVTGKPGSYYISDFLSGSPAGGMEIYNFGSSATRVQNIATYDETGTNLLGYLIIQTNMTMGNHMTTLNIKGYNYVPFGNIIDLNVSFYGFNADGNFYNYQVRDNGNLHFDDVQFLVRNSDGKIAIAIKPSGSMVWQYPKITVDALIGHFRPTTAALKNWTITRAGTLAGYTSKKQYTTHKPFMRAGLDTQELIGHGVWFTLINWTPYTPHPSIVYSGSSTFTVNEWGLYEVTFTCMFTNGNSANGARNIRILIDNQVVSAGYGVPIPAQNDYSTTTTTTKLLLAQGANIQFQAYQTSGDALLIHVDPYTHVTISRVD